MKVTVENVHETINKTDDETTCLKNLKALLSKLDSVKAKQLCEEHHNPTTQKYYTYYKYSFTGDALCRALDKGHHNVMKYLLDEIKVNPNATRNDTSTVRYGNDSSTCLYGAVTKKDHTAMKILLERGADPKINRSYTCTYYDSSDMPRDVTNVSTSPICAALENEDLEAVKLLLEYGCGNGVNDRIVCDAYSNSVESESKSNAVDMANHLGGEYIELFKQFNLIQ
ncbi:predicted protein [Naegleria gruberi]|uniref:Predicted protein n=1 Tax=Naegleria gruberi TaxID=5762 RepID=D2VRG0_NAEGR|nr:uncharacterized protein NAEGRDRAFT_71572 [Naegleria gruberi]EFC40665.1 predicted protein [Naegleria gruberi]|eukprot:XP_002673409.1 predicted protein [Naegleria gruberi strain NEG-M]